MATRRQRFYTRMTRQELDSLTVVKGKGGRGADLVNSSGFVRHFQDRDQAYAEVRRLRGLGARR